MKSVVCLGMCIWFSKAARGLLWGWEGRREAAEVGGRDPAGRASNRGGD